MELTKKQQEGLTIALKRYKEGKHYTVIGGFAGTGKTTLIHYIISALNLPEDEVAYCAPTGKAAQVLSSMGNKNATTIHRLLWSWKPIGPRRFRRERNFPLSKLIVCDEVSMVPKEIIDELLSHKECYIIFCGDPEQLPPVRAEDNNHLLDNPHIFLNEVVRQAQESDIIKATMDIRAGKALKPMNGNDIRIYSKRDSIDGMYLWADQIICATNRERNKINQYMVKLLGFTKDIDNGMKLINLENHWDIISSGGEPLVNGTIGIIRNLKKTQCVIPYWFKEDPIMTYTLDLELDNGDVYYNLIYDRNELLTGTPTITDYKKLYKINNYFRHKADRDPYFINTMPISGALGYAITCHKSQGSTFEKVLVIEEKFPVEKDERRKWEYTACTRPSKKLVVIQST